MEQIISRMRARMTRNRERNAVRASESTIGGPACTLAHVLLVVLLWDTMLMLLAAEAAIHREWSPSRLFFVASDGALFLVALFVAVLFLQITQPAIVRRISNAVLLSTIIALSLAVGEALIIASHQFGASLTAFPYVLPIGLASLLATLLLDSICGVAAGVVSSAGLSLLAGNSLSVLFAGLLASLAIAHLVPRAYSRTRVLKATIFAGLPVALCILADAAVDWRAASSAKTVVVHSVSLVAGSVLSAALAVLVLPALERLFQVSSNITLLEISNLGHPLLQRLAMEAPGTYHHSLMVAHLSQAAAEGVGANTLLVRVGAYFHDIGKLVKPSFFSENIQMRTNPHDDLQPSMSALVIASHVKEGVSIALVHRLPWPVIDIIREHHGTSLIAYFHHKAKAEVESEARVTGTMSAQPRVEESSFRYPGPRPGTRESALISLADAVEAASRSLEKPTPHRIESLVDDIVTAKILDGQLDEARLTFADLAAVKISFAFSLSNMLHGRIAYPKDENRNQQSAAGAPGGPSASRRPG